MTEDLDDIDVPHRSGCAETSRAGFCDRPVLGSYIPFDKLSSGISRMRCTPSEVERLQDRSWFTNLNLAPSRQENIDKPFGATTAMRSLAARGEHGDQGRVMLLHADTSLSLSRVTSVIGGGANFRRGSKGIVLRSVLACSQHRIASRGTVWLQ